MSAGDFIWGMIVAYILLGVVWLGVEKVWRGIKRRKRAARRSASVVDLRTLRRKRSA